tara:strand:- start:348 stop:506 length:159 start_codon:yes stop_codon:yes gene_type:complete
MYKKNIYKFRPKVSKKRKDVNIYLATQGKIKSWKEFQQLLERRRNEKGLSQD